MNVLIITQNFYPENFKSNDLAFELAARGHKVTVLTGLPNYPEGKIYPGYGFFKNTKQTINGVDIVRSWLFPRGKGSGFLLFINYFSFAFFASVKALLLVIKQKKNDVIIVHQTSPVIQCYPAWIIHKLTKTPIYLWVLDLWPESLEFAGGVKSKSILGFFTKMVKTFYNSSQKILVSSKGFRKSILEKGNYDDKIVYFPNWGEDVISNDASEYPIPTLPNGFKVCFAGNIGEAQDMNAVMEAALLLKNEKQIKFIIIGDGRKKKYVQEFITENSLEDTVFLLGRYPIEAMSTFFRNVDLMLVSLKNDPVFNITVPAKLQAYMSAGKPIVAMLNGDGAELIDEAECGYSVSAGDYVSLAEVIKSFSVLSQEDIRFMGENSKKYYQKHFTLKKCLNNLEKLLKIV